MRSEQLNDWLTLAANLAVLAGIIFLVIEISQNTDMMRTQINQSRAELAMNEAESLYNSDYIPSLLTKIRQGDDVSAEERERYSHLFRAFNRNWERACRSSGVVTTLMMTICCVGKHASVSTAKRNAEM